MAPTPGQQERQHRWSAELRVREATIEEGGLPYASWTRLELRQLKPGFTLLGNGSAENSWPGAALLRRSLANLFYFYIFPDPLPLFHTEGVSARPVGGGPPLPYRRRGASAAEPGGDRTGALGASSPPPATAASPTSVPVPGLVTLLVDGVALGPEESQGSAPGAGGPGGDFAAYWRAAATEQRFDLRVPPADGGGAPAHATVYLLYFPYRGDKETLPALNPEVYRGPAGEKLGVESDKALAAASSATSAASAGHSGKGRRGKHAKGWARGGADKGVAGMEEGLGAGGGIADNLCHVYWMGRYDGPLDWMWLGQAYSDLLSFRALQVPSPWPWWARRAAEIHEATSGSGCKCA